MPAAEASQWVEAIAPGEDNVTILARYTSGPFRGHAALTTHPVGAGQALYLGWYPTTEQAQALLGYLANKIDIPQLADDLPEGLVITQRGLYTLLLNFAETPLTATIAGQPVSVPPRDIKLLTPVTDRHA